MPAKRKPAAKGAGGQEKPAVSKPPTPLQTLQQPLKELRRAAQPLEAAQATPKLPAQKPLAPGAPVPAIINPPAALADPGVRAPNVTAPAAKKTVPTP